MSSAPDCCRICAGRHLSVMGSIPDSDFFAGRVLGRPIAGGHLYLCDDCDSLFRHPILAEREYASLYRDGAADAWKPQTERNDLHLVRQLIIAGGASRSVLDVGCNAGDFLISLPASFGKFGVEPSTAAAAQAIRGGIVIAGVTLESLPPDTRYDVITLIDVIEHLPFPTVLLDQAVNHLAPGGQLIVATGDPGYSLWRIFFRGRFWYAAFPEHISFPSRRALAAWSRTRGLEPPSAQRIRYKSLPAWKAAFYLVQMLIFRLSPALLNAAGRSIDALRRAPRPRRRFYSPGGPGTFSDHHVLTFHRPAPPLARRPNGLESGFQGGQ